MGSVKIDVEKGARTYAVRYVLNDAAGVKKLLRDRHHINSAQFLGDYNAVDTLVDLNSAISSAGLTDKQAEAVAWVYGIGSPIKRVAGVMSISEEYVLQCVNSAACKIADWFNAKGKRAITAVYTEVAA